MLPWGTACLAAISEACYCSRQSTIHSPSVFCISLWDPLHCTSVITMSSRGSRTVPHVANLPSNVYGSCERQALGTSLPAVGFGFRKMMASLVRSPHRPLNLASRAPRPQHFWKLVGSEGRACGDSYTASIQGICVWEMQDKKRKRSESPGGRFRV